MQVGGEGNSSQNDEGADQQRVVFFDVPDHPILGTKSSERLPAGAGKEFEAVRDAPPHLKCAPPTTEPHRMQSPAVDIKNNVIESLRVVLETPDGKRFHGSITEGDTESESARLICEFPRSSGLDLSIGEGVRLVLPNFYGRGEHIEEVKTILRLEDRLRVRYGFVVGREIALVYSRITDWRLATRVRPFPEAPVQAQIRPLDGRRSYTVEVEDISATGLGVTLSSAYESELFVLWRGGVAIQLPGSSESFEMVSNIVYRRPTRDPERIFYGLDFDAVATDGFADKQARIHKFVVGHLNAVLYSFRHGRLSWIEAQEEIGATAVSAKEPEHAPEARTLEPELEQLEDAWAELPAYVREAIMTLARGHIAEAQED